MGSPIATLGLLDELQSCGCRSSYRGSRFKSYVRLILLLESSGTEALLKFGCLPLVHMTRPKHLSVMVLPPFVGHPSGGQDIAVGTFADNSRATLPVNGIS